MFEFIHFHLIIAWAFASFAQKPLHILIPHLLHLHPSYVLDLNKCPREILEENGSHKSLEPSTCMNLDDFQVQMHLEPLLGLHWPTPVLTHAFFDHVAAIMNH